MSDAEATKLDPRRTALLVMDYQPGMILPGQAEVVEVAELEALLG
jgi:nicotinamidase-related amidase